MLLAMLLTRVSLVPSIRSIVTADFHPTWCSQRAALRLRRADETVFELTVPTDDPKFLQDALRIFSQFATSIRCSEEDLAKERGAVLDVRPCAVA